MSFEYLHKIPTANEIIQEMPLSARLKNDKEERDREIISVFKGESQKFILIIGPCSADDENAVCEYVARLAKLQSEVSEKLILIPRVYTNKPRTTGIGYKGMMHQPNSNEAPNIVRGLKALRRMHLRLFKETGLSAADEMLYPSNYPYLEDILSYVTVGARSVENQQHRLTVSGIDVPVGMKNPTSGDLNVMLNSVQAAQSAHTFIYRGWEVKTSGNPYAHCILRGAVNQHGQSIPNYHYEDMIRLAEFYHKRELENQAIIVDTSHANSNKKFDEQPRIAMDVVHSMRNSRILKALVKGLMIESYLEDGAQEVGGKIFGKSITDSCLGWESSRKLVLKLAEYI
jgi:3-deoxy-7-phosphoheptulonate synthase